MVFWRGRGHLSSSKTRMMTAGGLTLGHQSQGLARGCDVEICGASMLNSGRRVGYLRLKKRDNCASNSTLGICTCFPAKRLENKHSSLRSGSPRASSRAVCAEMELSRELISLDSCAYKTLMRTEGDRPELALFIVVPKRTRPRRRTGKFSRG